MSYFTFWAVMKTKMVMGHGWSSQLLGKIQHLELATFDSYVNPAILPYTFSQTVLPHPGPLQQPAPRSRCIHGRFPQQGPSVHSGCWWWDRSPSGSSQNPVALSRDTEPEDTLSSWIRVTQLLSSQRLLVSREKSVQMTSAKKVLFSGLFYFRSIDPQISK